MIDPKKVDSLDQRLEVLTEVMTRALSCAVRASENVDDFIHSSTDAKTIGLAILAAKIFEEAFK